MSKRNSGVRRRGRDGAADEVDSEPAFSSLLRPLLERAASGGVTLVRSEDTGLLVPQPSDRVLSTTEERNPGATSSAIHNLEVAGLVVPVKRGNWLWRTSAEGRELLDRVSGEIGVSVLRAIPRYFSYWAKLEEERRRREILDRRVEHYAAGRMLASRGLYRASAVEFAYAIEFHLKAALGEVKLDDSDQRLLESSHDLPRLFGLCRKYDVLGSARVSLDFLCLARDHFERRYPRGEQALMERERYMRYGQDTLPVYDDCIIQLDLALAADYDTTDFLLGTGALHGFPFIPAIAESIFAGNVFAYQHADTYMKQPAWGRFAGTTGCAIRDPRELSGPGPTGEWRGQVGADALLKSQLAELYRYPRRGDPDPNPARLIPSFQRRLPIFTPEWVVKRAIAHFGSGNVEVVEEGHAPRTRIDLVVFDRGATRWWKKLALRHDFHELWRESPATRMRLERWFKEAEEQFRERWNGKPASDRIARQKAVRHPLYWTRHAKK